ncbi:MAG: PKD domain-containing protein [Bacteroidia bacterium]
MYLLQSKNYLYYEKSTYTRFVFLKHFFAFILLFSSLSIKAQNSDLQQSYFKPLNQYANSEKAEDAIVEFASRLDSCHILNAVAAQTGASKADMIIFSNYYADTLYSDRADYASKMGNPIKTDADIQQFVKTLVVKYVNLYQKLQQIKTEYPNTVSEYGSPQLHRPVSTCNPSCSDIGFESGTLTGWNAYYAGNNSTATKMTYTNVVGGACGAVTQAAYDVVTDPKYHKAATYQVKIMSGAGNDPIAGPIIPIVAPGAGNYSCRLGDTSIGGSRVAIIDQAFTVTAGNTALNYMYAPIVDMPGYQYPHTWGQQPHFIVTITDQGTGDTLQCGDYLVTSSTTGTNYTPIYYKVPAYGWWDTVFVAPWKTVFVSLQNYVGHCIDIQAIVSDCYPTAIGPHFCYVYFDATCGPLSIIESTPSVCGGNVTLTAPPSGVSYAWTGPCIVGNSTLQTATAGCSGTYTVTITSADGCTDTLQKVITITPTMSVTATSTNATCSTAGTATANPTGGTGPYTYKWSNGSTNQKDTGLAPGNYTCTVSASGCVDTVDVTITGGGSITETIANVDVKCNGGNTGSATANPAGGKTPYTYLWNNGNTNQTISNLAAGTYTCVVKDANGCKTSQTVTITQPTALSTSTSETGTPCGATTGTASVTVTGGTPGYTYLWSGGQTTSGISNLAGGVNTVIITDANGCTTTTSVTVPSTNGPAGSILSSTNILCFGGNNGSAEANATGGTSPYTYSWTGGQTTATATGLSAGSYTVTITDNTGCIASTTVTITQPPALRDSTDSTNVICFGGSNGSATVGVKGGTPNYTYSWNTAPVQTGTTATGLTAGTYIVRITDADGCKDSSTVTISQPPLIQLSLTSFPATCHNSCNAQSIVVPSGGTNPFTYLWSNGTTTADNTAMCVDSTYTIKVTDRNGCTHDTSVTVLQPAAIVIKSDSTPALCDQADGSAGIAVSGGTPGYTYKWSTGTTNTTDTIVNVAPGTYTVHVTDANGCPDSATIIVPDISGVNVAITSTTKVSCFGDNNGSAVAAASSGTPPYTFTWNTNPGQNGTSATGLTAGSYTVTVTDSAGCSNTAVATITQPNPVTVSVPGQTICIGQKATLTANANGGTAPYTYLWTPGGSGQSIIVSPTVTTTYTVLATDANGCTDSIPVVVKVRPPLTVIAGPPKSICPGSGGSDTITATGTGGDSLYFYSWKPTTGLNTNTGATVIATPTVTTTYTVTLTDDCGTPPDSAFVTVTVLPSPVANFIADTLEGCYPLCVKFNDLSTPKGTITSWNWNFGDGGTSTVEDTEHCYDKTGIYTVSLSITSSNGCIASKTIDNYITVYAHPVANFTLSPQPTTILNPTIYFTDLSTDDYGIQSWLWSFGDATDSISTIKDPQHTYQDTGSYCAQLIVTNIHGCKDTTTKCLEIEPYFVIYVPNAFTPNNSSGLNNLFTAKGVGILDYQMWIFDRWGQQLYYTTDIYGGWNGKVQGGTSGTQAQEDTYVWLIEVTDVFHKEHRYVGRVTLIK